MSDRERSQQIQPHQKLLETAIAADAAENHTHTSSHNLILGLDKGVWVAAGLIMAWATMIHITVFHTPLHSLQAVALFWPMMQLHTG